MQLKFAYETNKHLQNKGGPKKSQYQFIGSDNVHEVAWYKDNTSFSSKPVGLKKPNELGIYDMPGKFALMQNEHAGNVFEYCTDGMNILRTLRGGGWSSRKESMRATYKNGCRIDEAHSYVGFRLVRSIYQ